MITIDDTGVGNLVSSIVLQAVKDYKAALKRYNKERDKEKKSRAGYEIQECERFFREELSAYCKIDGERIISKVRGDVEKSLNNNGIIMRLPG